MRRFLPALLAALVSLLAACGVPTDASPHAISPTDVPFGLLSPTPTTRNGPPLSARTRQIFFVHDTRLAGISADLVDPTVTDLLNVLLAGPTDQESQKGLRTAVPAGTVLHDATQVRDIVTLDLSSQLLQVRTQEQTLAIAQIVFTATAAPGIRYVRFRLNGQPLQVPRGNGTLSDIVTRHDYLDLAPAP